VALVQARFLWHFPYMESPVNHAAGSDGVVEHFHSCIALFGA
jgi:hypothetical protein